MSIKHIKTFIGFILVLVLCAPLSIMLGGCGNSRTPDIVVSGFAQYDWVRQILGDNPSGLSVKYLLDNGVDLHNYQPSVEDIASIGSCKLFIYTDSDAEKWISSTLSNPKNKDRKVLNLISLLSKDEKIALDEESGHVHDENCDHEYDEHIWLSLKLSQKFVTVVADRLGTIDPDNAELYFANAQNYNDKLDGLDQDYEQTVSNKIKKKILIADRYPFAYMMRDYGIEVSAAFSGCAASTEISIQKVAELKAYLTQNNLNFVLILENSETRVANQIIDGTSAQIRILNSLQSVPANKLSTTYLEIMKSNLEVLDLVLE